MTVEHVYDLMRRASPLPYGEARTMLVEEALRRADETGDAELAFSVRIELMSAYQLGGEPIKTFGVFTRALADFDRDPGALGDRAEHKLLWEFKGMVYSMTLFPQVPLAQAWAVLEDMERRYVAGGHSLQAVHMWRTAMFRHIGDAAAADDSFRSWVSTPRDALSDCEGCDLSDRVAFLEWRGRDGEALEQARTILETDMSCIEQPASALTRLLPVYLRSGRLDGARTAHLRAYRQLRTRLSELGPIGAHVEFCALTGNEARGLEIVERHLDWLDRAPSPLAELRFAAAAALLLGRVAAAGHGDRTVARRTGEERTVAEVRDELAATATRLAALFDERNGTSEQGDRVRRVLAAEPVVERLPLLAVPAGPSGGGPRAARPKPVPVADLADVTEPGAALDRADAEWKARNVPAALAAWERYDALLGDAEPSARDRARREDGRGLAAIEAGDLPAAIECWQRAVELYEAAGDADNRHAAESRLGGLYQASDRLDEAFPLLAGAVAYFDEHDGDVHRRTAARARLAAAHLAAADPGAALTVLAGAKPDDADDAARVELLRGRAFGAAGDEHAAVAAFRASLAAARDAGDADVRAEAGLHLGSLLRHLGHQSEDGRAERWAEALDALDEAVANFDHSMLRLAAHAERGDLLLELDRAADAVPDLAEAVAGFTAAGERESATYARVGLAAAYYGAERHLEAAEAAEEALADVVAQEDAGAERRCRLIIAHARRELGEVEAADAFANLAELARAHGDSRASAHFLEESAEVLTSFDRDGDAAGRFAAAADTYVVAGDPYGAVRTLRRGAMCHWWDGEGDDALSGMARARTALGELPQDNVQALTWETALIDYDTARVLAGLGRTTDALAAADAAVAGFTELGEDQAAAQATELRNDLRSSLD
ncbi:hypothetical protein [Actinomadura atramentaria]|uniref:hypothetical protein n=1 Tax=Actinomadura atramentaria TaxID=1990 RepID=UPI0003765F96|nr:hypothetical protein [Actinomadura atramentaria]